MEITRPSKSFPKAIRMIRDSVTGQTTFQMIRAEDPLPHPPIPYLPPGVGTPIIFTTTAELEREAALAAASASIPAPPDSLAEGGHPTTPTYPVSSDPSLPPDFSRHSRRCSICCHPDRDLIEGEFVRWRSPEMIARTFRITDRTSIYRHAHAVGLFPRRKRELGRVLEHILESIECCRPESHDVIIRAARLYSHLDDHGKWFEAPRTQYLVSGPPSETLENLAGASRHATNVHDSQIEPEILTATDPNSKIG
jgi:hypothetical protein